MSGKTTLNQAGIVTDLNNKADLDLSNMNASQSAKNTIMSWGLPKYSSIITISSSTSQVTYTAPSNGVLYFNYDATQSAVTVNGQSIIAELATYYNNSSVTLYLSKNDVVVIPTLPVTAYFVPLKGV